MSLSLWTERSLPTVKFQNEFDRLFNRLGENRLARGIYGDVAYEPACEISDAGNHFVLYMEIPGVTKKDIQLEVYNQELIISGERRSLQARLQNVISDEGQNKSGEGSASSEEKMDSDSTLYSELQFGKFERRFKIPVGIEADKIGASYQEGVLCVTIPKAESARPKQIKIADGNSLN